MFERLLLAAAGVSAAMLPVLPAGAEQGTAEPSVPTPTEAGAAQHCVMFTVQTPQGAMVDESTVRCYDTLSSAVARRGQLRSGFTIATHFENSSGGGSSVTIQGGSCTATWTPGSWWRDNMSSTRLGASCSGAKHYTGASCSGSYQIVSALYPTITNLNSTLNNNVGCVKYA